MKLESQLHSHLSLPPILKALDKPLALARRGLANPQNRGGWKISTCAPEHGYPKDKGRF